MPVRPLSVRSAAGGAWRYAPRTPEGFRLWVRANDVAKVTGRVVFGQLWFPDPTVDDVLYANVVHRLRHELNRPSVLYQVLNARQ